ncbi:hypothetical protein, partial [Nocardia africana]
TQTGARRGCGSGGGSHFVSYFGPYSNARSRRGIDIAMARPSFEFSEFPEFLGNETTLTRLAMHAQPENRPISENFFEIGQNWRRNSASE